MKSSFLGVALGVLLIPQLGVSQKVPGYLGKRFSVEYNAFMFSSLANPNGSQFTPRGDWTFKPRGISVNWQNNFIAQWSISKRTSLVGSFHFAKTNFLPSATKDYNATFREYPGMQVYGGEVGLRFFRDHFAPLGHFLELHVGLSEVSNDDFSYFFEIASGQPPIFYTISGGSMLRPSFGVAIGSNRIIKDRILFSYGLNANIFTGGFGQHVFLIRRDTRENLSFYDGNSEYNQETLTKMAAGRYGVQSMINIRLGIGFIL